MEASYYELLGLTIEASEQEISRAYKLKALKVHPDKNPNNADAAAKFHELHKAYTVLTDQDAKAAYDKLLRIKIERQKRDNEMDAKRRDMKATLLEKERLAKLRKEMEEAARKDFEESLRNLKEKAKKTPKFSDLFPEEPSEQRSSPVDFSANIDVKNRPSDFEEYEKMTLDRLRKYQSLKGK